MTSATLDRRNLLTSPSGQVEGADTVTLLTVYLLLLMAIPSDEVFGPLGGAGAPANLLGVSFLIVYLFKLLHPSFQIGSSRLPMRLVVILLLCSILVSYVGANLHKTSTAVNVNGADRGLVMFSGWLGIFLLTADGISTFERLMKLLERIVLGTTCIAAIGFIQFFTGKNLATYINIPALTVARAYTDVQIRGAYNRPQATTSHPIEFAFVLATVLPIAIHLARHAPKDRRRFRWAQVALIALMLPLTISRSAFIGLAAIAIVLVPVWRRRERLIALAVTASAFVAVQVVAPGLLAEIGDLFLAIGSDSSTRSRTGAYSSAAPLIARHPFFGTGFGTFDPQVFFYTDNEYLNSAIEIGLVGMLILVALIISGWITARQSRLASSDPEIRHLAQCMAASCAVILTVSATFDSLYFAMAAGMTFLLLGCVGALYRLAPAKETVCLSFKYLFALRFVMSSASRKASGGDR